MNIWPSLLHFLPKRVIFLLGKYVLIKENEIHYILLKLRMYLSLCDVQEQMEFYGKNFIGY